MPATCASPDHCLVWLSSDIVSSPLSHCAQSILARLPQEPTSALTLQSLLLLLLAIAAYYLYYLRGGV